ncbi:MAG: aromatic ring-hydroxylating dioxygenase subunit alpha, partial [Acinetobacter sp.]|nr:aromatic ring-hydroxylating dioxygenase subunit alpha [Acinetobacter sp.]
MNSIIPTHNIGIDYDALVQSDRAHTSLYKDERIFDEEMEKIFYSTWVWVAHASEIPEGGSYKTINIGKQPVVVVRDRKKKVHVLLNRCRHRAATVCEHKKGKTNSFVCPYHGWSYALDGSLRGVPSPESYGDCLDKTELPLVSLRVEEYNGMIFASFKEDIQPLEEFLGPAKKWIDLFMKQGAGYPIKVLGEHRFRFPGNWKIQLENTTDAYH